METVKPDSFEEGVLYAAAMLVRLFDEPRMAANILVEAGLENANLFEMDEYDKELLRMLNAENGINLKFYPPKTPS